MVHVKLVGSSIGLVHVLMDIIVVVIAIFTFALSRLQFEFNKNQWTLIFFWLVVNCCL
jgi:uncharacterized membrane protein YjdF